MKPQEKKILNVRIGVEFYNKLNSHPAFQLNWKAISPAFYFLQRIATLNDMNNGKAVEFYSVNIQNIFRPYCPQSDGDFAYKKYLNALESLELLTIGNSYIVGNDDIEGVCKTYLVTTEGVDLLSAANVEYLKALHTDQKVIRKTQQSISKRAAMHSTYSDYVLNYIADGLNHFNYDYDKAMSVVSGSGWSPLTQQSAEQSLISFKTKDFGNLQYNKTDGRVFNEFVSMKSDLRQAFKYKKMTRMAVIDIRACHPTFFSTYILEYVLLNNNFSTLPILPHYVMDKGDRNQLNPLIINKPSPKSLIINEPSHNPLIINEEYNYNKSTLEMEHEKWLNLFTNPLIDPRDVIGSEIDRTKAEVKEALSQTLNGSKKYKKVLDWLEKTFPCLYAIWQTTDIKQTGCNISRLYESKVMLHPEIYKQTEAQGLKIAYEYDGISVFSDDIIKRVLIGKVEYLAKRIKFLAETECGVKLVLKVEFDDSLQSLF
jgi:hypothetical protein